METPARYFSALGCDGEREQQSKDESTEQLATDPSVGKLNHAIHDESIVSYDSIIARTTNQIESTSTTPTTSKSDISTTDGSYHWSVYKTD